MNEQNLDEMQLSRRNRIGNQSFMLLFYLLLLNIGFSGLGIKWLDYPLSVFIIMIAVMGIYLIRIILAGAYTAQTKNTGVKTRRTWGTALASGVACFAVIVYLQGGKNEDGDWGALVLFLLSAGVLLVSILLQQWSERRNNKDDE